MTCANKKKKRHPTPVQLPPLDPPALLSWECTVLNKWLCASYFPSGCLDDRDSYINLRKESKNWDFHSHNAGSPTGNKCLFEPSQYQSSLVQTKGTTEPTCRILSNNKLLFKPLNFRMIYYSATDVCYSLLLSKKRYLILHSKIFQVGSDAYH